MLLNTGCVIEVYVAYFSPRMKSRSS